MDFMFNILQHICRPPICSTFCSIYVDYVWEPQWLQGFTHVDYLALKLCCVLYNFMIYPMEVKVLDIFLTGPLSSLPSMLSKTMATEPRISIDFGLIYMQFLCGTLTLFCANFSTNVCRISTFFSQVSNFEVLVVQNHAPKFLKDL